MTELPGGPSTQEPERSPFTLTPEPAEAYLRAVLDQLPAAIYATDALGSITYFNNAAGELWKQRPPLRTREWSGFWKLYRPDMRRFADEEYPAASVIRKRQPLRAQEALVGRADGTHAPVLLYSTSLLKGAGELSGTVTLLTDVREYVPADDLQRHFAAIVESSSDAIISKDLNGIISSWNRAAEHLLGYRAEEAIGQSIMKIIPADRVGEEAMIIAAIRKGEKVDHFETVRQRKDGSLVELSISVSPVRNARGQIIGAAKIARDISERRRAEKQRELFLDEMKHRTKNLMAVVEAIAHQSRPRNDPQSAELLDVFVGRLRALMATGEIVVGSTDRKAPLVEIFKKTLAPFEHPEQPSRMVLDGPAIEVSERTAGGLALAVHELATNALKYGALTTRNGRVNLNWTQDPPGLVRIEWKETGGPSIGEPPARTGFGSRMIRAAIAHERDAESTLSFPPDGVHCKFEFRIV